MAARQRVCDDVLRAVDPSGPTLSAVVTESLAYSTLQAGPEFARWLAERGPARMPEFADPVLAHATVTPYVSCSTGPNVTTRFPPCARRGVGGVGGRAAGPVGDRDRAEWQRPVVL